MNQHVSQLLKAIEDGSEEDVWEAAQTLSAETTELTLALLRLLAEARRPTSRGAAAYVLGFGRFASARIPLQATLDTDDELGSVRGYAAEALAYLQSNESIDVLLRHTQDADPQVSYWCIFALGEIGDPDAIPTLARVADQREKRWYETHSLQTEALDAIQKIQQRRRSSAPNDE
jgi:HEAT repeat protein